MLSVLSVAKPRGDSTPQRPTSPRLRDWTWQASTWRHSWWTHVVRARSSTGEWRLVRVDNRWVFRVTRELIDDCGCALEVRGYVAVYDDVETNCRVYARRGIAWAVRAERAWRRRHFCVERALVRRGVLLCEEGSYLSAWRFNWDWRWYDKASWGRRAAAWRSAQTLR